MFRPAILRALTGGVAVAFLALSQDAVDAVQARERVLYATAFEPSTHKPVLNLGPTDFVVREDGVTREVLRVTPATTPMPIALLVDNTQAASSSISDIRRALSAFVTTATDLGPIALITFADRPTILVDYTTSVKELQTGIGRVFAMPGSGATLLDAIKDASQGLAKREADRTAIVVLTTESTEFSTLHYTQVLDAVRASGASVHALVLLNHGASMTNDEARNRATVLDRGPRETGGVRINVLAASAFETQLRDLAVLLKSQYRVVYARPQSLIPPERVELSAAKPGVEAHGTAARGQATK